MKRSIVLAGLVVSIALLTGCGKSDNPVNNSSLLAPLLYSPLNGSTGRNTVMTLTWTKVTDAAMYEVQVSTNNTFSNITVADSMVIGASDTISKTLQSLAPNTEYYWRVRSKNSVGVSVWTGAWNFTTYVASPALEAPSNGAIDQPVTAMLTWDAAVGTFSATYRLQVSLDNSFASTIVDDSNLTSTSITINSLSNGATYYWRVNAKSSVGVGQWSNTWNFTVIPMPPALPVLVSPANGATGISPPANCTWNAAARAVTYHFQASTDVSFSSTIADDPSVTGTSRAMTNLGLGTAYYWRLTAKNDAGVSPWTAAWRFTSATSNFKITSPVRGTVYNMGVTFTIKWTYADTSIDSVDILRNIRSSTMGWMYLTSQYGAPILFPVDSFPYNTNSDVIQYLGGSDETYKIRNRHDTTQFDTVTIHINDHGSN